MKNWALLDSNIVVHAFSATKEVADSALDRVKEMNTLPDWYSDDLTLVDITESNPIPVVGWYKSENGSWVDGNPNLSADRYTIPADGSTTATVTFSQKGPNAPSTVVFDVNGVDVSETLSSNGTATCEVVSSNPGDVIVVSANGASVTITVEG